MTLHLSTSSLICVYVFHRLGFGSHDHTSHIPHISVMMCVDGCIRANVQGHPSQGMVCDGAMLGWAGGSTGTHTHTCI